MDSWQLFLIPLLPFLGFVINGLLGKRLGTRGVSFFACALPIGSFLVAWSLFQQLTGPESFFSQTVFTWIDVEGHDGASLTASFKLLLDPLSAIMCLVVTGIGSLIHIYSIGYMKGDPSFSRFFAYLNLFTAFMLVLVLADNLLLLFVGWEGVGLCSYLLIGFWYQESENAQAGNKAFIVNRIGDFGVLLAMFLLFLVFGTLDMQGGINALLGDEAFNAGVGNKIAGWLQSVGFLAEGEVFDPAALRTSMFTVITLLLFLGCTGKSAQIPLFVWLPDAMAGPTPVSALIHAATMVTSGVYLCCRLHPLFLEAPVTMDVIMVIGAVTALLAALIAISQNDIKKVLAYSTVSQLGYMFFAVGMGAFSAGLFHVVTHAFFKALLFLGSGAVIIAMHHEQDIRKMGGLKRQLGFTHAVFLIGTLALAGFPLMSGFISKDEILFLGFEHSKPLWAVCWVTAGLTAFYMFRLVSLTFWGESRVDEKLAGQVHEPSRWMLYPLGVLAVLSLIGGYFNWPHFLFHGEARMTTFTELPPFGEEHDSGAAWFSAGLSVAMAFAGIGLAIYFFGPGREIVRRFADEPGIGHRLTSWSRNKFYVDEIYDWVVVKPLGVLAQVLFWVVDRFLIDTVLVNGTGALTRLVGEGARRIQSGFVPAYLATFGLGVVLLLIIVLLKLTGKTL